MQLGFWRKKSHSYMKYKKIYPRKIITIFSNLLPQQILQSFYFSLAFINDFVGSNEVATKDQPLIKKIKDFVFATFALPLALDVSILFWSLYAMDRRSVFPDELDSFFPSWLNHILHTNIAIFVIIELIVLHRNYPARKESLTAIALFMSCYLIWLHITRYYAGKWTYPILDTLDVPGKILFMAFISAFLFSMYFLGEFLNRKVWNASRIEKCTSENNETFTRKI